MREKFTILGPQQTAVVADGIDAVRARGCSGQSRCRCTIWLERPGVALPGGLLRQLLQLELLVLS